jgi:hypothetical protein
MGAEGEESESDMRREKAMRENGEETRGSRVLFSVATSCATSMQRALADLVQPILRRRSQKQRTGETRRGSKRTTVSTKRSRFQ